MLSQRVIRYADLLPCRNAFVDSRTPGSDAKENFTLIGPGVSENPSQHVHIAEPHGFNIGGARQPPRCLNSQHSHETAEVFIVHKGRWRMIFGVAGDEGEAMLAEGDVISIPTQMFRGFENVGEGMRHEYEAIVAAGLILQIDAPDLGLGRHMMYPDLDEAAFLRRAARYVEVINHALRHIPPGRVRLHICWGNYEGPHTRDIALARILPFLLQLRIGGLLFEASNPRHAHEWTVWQDTKLPAEWMLIPGCLDSTTNFVEHPELVAQRIETFARLVGPERVIAGTDCGFSTFAGYGAVHGDIAWAKLAALTEGARIASARL